MKVMNCFPCFWEFKVVDVLLLMLAVLFLHDMTSIVTAIIVMIVIIISFTKLARHAAV